MTAETRELRRICAELYQQAIERMQPVRPLLDKAYTLAQALDAGQRVRVDRIDFLSLYEQLKLTEGDLIPGGAA